MAITSGNGLQAIATVHILETNARNLFSTEYKEEIEKAGGDLEKYIKDNPEKYKEVRARYYAIFRATFPFTSDKVWKFASNAGATIHIAEKIKSLLKKPDPAAIPAYQTLAPVASKLLDHITAKTSPLSQTAEAFMEDFVDTAVNYSYAFSLNAHSSLSHQRLAWKNALEKGEFMEYDLENIGNDILEYAFVNAKIGNKPVKGLPQMTHVSGIVGLNDNQYKKYMGMVERWIRSGINNVSGLAENEVYMLQNLAKMGHEKTKWHWENGRAVLDAFASNQDVSVKEFSIDLQKDRVLRGLKAYNEIFHGYEQNMVTFHGQQMYAYEQDILERLMDARTRGITVSGHNQLIHDNPLVNTYFLGGNASAGAQTVFRESVGDVRTLQNFDLLAVARQAGRLGRDAASAVAETGESANTVTAMIQRYAPEVPGLVKNYLGSRYVEHASLADSIRQAMLKTSMVDQLLNADSDDYFFRDYGRIRRTAVGDVFMVERGLLEQNGNGAFSFVYDNFNKQFQFAGGVKVSQDGRRAGEYGVVQGQKKGVAYLLADIKEFRVTDEFRKAGASISSDLAAGQNLVAMSFVRMSGEINRTRTFAAENPIVLVTTREDAAERLSHMPFLGNVNMNKAGNVISSWRSLSPLGRASIIANGLKWIDEVTDLRGVDQEGKQYGLAGKKYTLSGALVTSDTIAKNDAAAGWLRRNPYNQAQAAIKIAKEIEKMGAETSEERRKNMNMLVDEAERIGRKSRLFNILHYKSKGGAGELFSNTIDSASNSVEWMYSMKDIFQDVISAVNKRTNDERLKPLYFNAYFENVMSMLALQNGSGFSDMTGRTTTMPLTERQKNTFSIILPGVNGKSSLVTSIWSSLDNSFDIYLGNRQDPGLGDRLAKRMGMDDPVLALRTLQNQISRQYAGYGWLADHSNSPYQKEYETQRLIDALRDIRKNNPNAGVSNPAAIADISHQSSLADFYGKLTESQKETLKEQAFDPDNVEILVPRGSAREISNKYVEEYIFRDTKNITADDLLKYGYDTDEAGRIITDRNRRIKEAKKLYGEIFETIYGNKNKEIAIAIQKNGGVQFIDTSSGQAYDITNNIMFDKFDERHGTFYTKMGGRRVATTTGFFDVAGKNDKVVGNPIFGSSYSGFYGRLIEDIGHVNANDRATGDRIRLLMHYMSEAGKIVAENAVMRYNEKEALLGRMADFSGLFERMGYLQSHGAYKDMALPEDLAKTLEGLASRYEKQDSQKIKLSTSEKTLLYKNLNILLSPFAQKGSEARRLIFGNNSEAADYFAEVIPHINLMDLKQADKMFVSLTRSGILPFTTETEDGRHIGAVMKSTHEIDLEEHLRKDYMERYRDILRQGNVFQNRYNEAKALTDASNPELHLDYESRHTFRAKKLSISTKDWEAALASKEAKDVLASLHNSSPLFHYLNEGGGIIDPRLLAMLPANIEQKFKTNQLADMNLLQAMASKQIFEAEAKRRQATQDVIEIVHGRIRFDYGGEVWVNAKDTVAWDESYAGTLSRVSADRSGFLRLRYQDAATGKIITGEAIEDILNQEENRKRITRFGGWNIKDAKEDIANILARREIADILKERGIQQKYFIESAEINNYRKFLDTTEKMMAAGIMPYIGQEDTRLRSVMKEIGLERKNLFLHDKTIDDRTRFSMMAKGMGGEELTDKILGKAGFRNYDEFRDAVYKERSMYFDAAVEVARKTGHLKDNEYVSVISGNALEAAKGSHETVARIQERFGRAVRYLAENNGYDWEAARDTLYGALEANGAFRKSDIHISGARPDQIVINEDFVMNARGVENALRSIASNKDFDTLFLRGEGSMIQEASLAAIEDADAPGFNKIRATRRMLQNLTQERWGTSALKKVLDDYGSLYHSPERAVEKFNEQFAGIATASYDGKTYGVAMEKGVNMGAINAPILQNLKEEIVNGNNPFDVISTDEALKGNIERLQAVQELKLRGIDPEETRGYIQELADKGYRNVSMTQVADYHSYATGRLAINVNKELANAGLSQQEEIVERLINGKSPLNEVLRLSDLDKVRDRLFFGDPDRMIGRSFILDLGDYTTKSGSRYIAIPYLVSSIMDNNRFEEGIYSRKELIEKISETARLVSRTAPMAGESSQEYYRGKILDNINEIVDGVIKSTNTKGGAVADATQGYLTGSYMAKADTIRVHRSKNPLLEIAKVDGESIYARMAAGKETNAVFLGRDFFENALMTSDMRNIIDQLGIDNGTALDSMLDSISTRGAMGIGLRQPMEYTNSVAAAYLYYDPNAKDRIRMTESMARAMKSDLDGDTVYAHMLRARAKVNIDGQEFTARLSEEQVRFLQEYEDRFKDANPDVNISVQLENPNFFNEIRRTEAVISSGALSGFGPVREDDIVDAIIEQKNFRTAEIAGNIYSASHLHKNREELAKRYEEITAAERFQQAVAGYNADYGTNISEDILSAQHITGEKDRTGIAERYLSGLSQESDEYAKAAEAFAYRASDLRIAEEVQATLARGDAGLANNPVFRLKNVISLLENQGLTGAKFTSDDAEVVNATVTHMLEAFQAAKNSTALGLSTNDLSNAIGDFLGANGKRDNTRLFSLLDTLYDHEIKEFKTLPSYESLPKDTSRMISRERMKEAFSNLMDEGKTLNPYIFRAQDIGFAKALVDSNYRQQNTDDMFETLQAVMDRKLEEWGVTEATSRESQILVEERNYFRKIASDAHRTRTSMLEESAQESTADLIRSSFYELKGRIGSKGAIAMLGFAGLTMMAGIAAGAPTSPTPAQGQAQGIQSNDALYELPSTIGSSVFSNTANQGYIINVNASTDEGRDFAVNVVNQAFSMNRQTSTGNSITMNIKDSSSNISYSDIASYIGAML